MEAPTEEPPQRYEHTHPGSLFHVDAKGFGRIEGIGHAIHGDRPHSSLGGLTPMEFAAGLA